LRGHRQRAVHPAGAGFASKDHPGFGDLLACAGPVLCRYVGLKGW